jgi:2-iminobutanoate/2-iminopropanoate deaminase
MRRWQAVLSLTGLMACEQPRSTPPGVEYFPMAGDRSFPFSAAVRAGPVLFLSGQIGLDSTGRLVPGGIEAETRQTLENIRALLRQHGSSLDRVVKCTVMLADIGDWPAMNRVYSTFFPAHPPARSAFGTSGLAFGARTEIECLATVE